MSETIMRPERGATPRCCILKGGKNGWGERVDKVRGVDLLSTQSLTVIMVWMRTETDAGADIPAELVWSAT